MVFLIILTLSRQTSQTLISHTYARQSGATQTIVLDGGNTLAVLTSPTQLSLVSRSSGWGVCMSYDVASLLDVPYDPLVSLGGHGSVLAVVDATGNTVVLFALSPPPPLPRDGDGNRDCPSLERIEVLASPPEMGDVGPIARSIHLDSHRIAFAYPRSKLILVRSMARSMATTTTTTSFSSSTHPSTLLSYTPPPMDADTVDTRADTSTAERLVSMGGKVSIFPASSQLAASYAASQGQGQYEYGIVVFDSTTAANFIPLPSRPGSIAWASQNAVVAHSAQDCTRVHIVELGNTSRTTLTLPSPIMGIPLAGGETLLVHCERETHPGMGAEWAMVVTPSLGYGWMPEAWSDRSDHTTQVWILPHSVGSSGKGSLRVHPKTRCVGMGVGPFLGVAGAGAARAFSYPNMLLSFATNAAFLPAVIAAWNRGWVLDTLVGVLLTLASSAYHWSDVSGRSTVMGVDAGSWHRLDNVCTVLAVQGLLLRVYAPSNIRLATGPVRMGLGLLALMAGSIAPWSVFWTLVPIGLTWVVVAWDPLSTWTWSMDLRVDWKRVVWIGMGVVAFWRGLVVDESAFRWRHAVWHLCMGRVFALTIHRLPRARHHFYNPPPSPGLREGRVLCEMVNARAVVVGAAVGAVVCSTLGTGVVCVESGWRACAVKFPLASDAAVIGSGAFVGPTALGLVGVSAWVGSRVLGVTLDNVASWKRSCVECCGWIALVAMTGVGVVTEVTGETLHVVFTGLAVVCMVVTVLLSSRSVVVRAGVVGWAVLLLLMHARIVVVEVLIPQLVYAGVEIGLLLVLVSAQVYAVPFGTTLTLHRSV